MKKILICLMVLIFTIGFVSASENNTIISVNNSMELESNNNDYSFEESLQSSESSELLNAKQVIIYVNSSKETNGDGSSWQEAYNGSTSWNDKYYDAKGNIINNAIIHMGEGIYSQNSLIEQKKGCTYIGQGENTVLEFMGDDGNSAGASLTFVNITLIKSFDSNNELTIANLKANYKFINCTLVDLPLIINPTITQTGFRTWKSFGSAYFENCQFKNINTSILIHNNYAHMFFNNCIFENITAESIVSYDIGLNYGLEQGVYIYNSVFKKCNVKGILKVYSMLSNFEISNCTYDFELSNKPLLTGPYVNTTDINPDIYVNASNNNGDGSSWENATNVIPIKNNVVIYLSEGEYNIPNSIANVTYVGKGNDTVITKFSFGGQYYFNYNKLIKVINATFKIPQQVIGMGMIMVPYNVQVDDMNFEFINCTFINSSFISRVYNKQTPNRDFKTDVCSSTFYNCSFKNYYGDYLINNWEYSKFNFYDCNFENITANAIIDSYGGNLDDFNQIDGIYIYNSTFKNCSLAGIVKTIQKNYCTISNCSYDFIVSNQTSLNPPYYINSTDKLAVPIIGTIISINEIENGIIIYLCDEDNNPLEDELSIVINDKLFYKYTNSEGKLILDKLYGYYKFEVNYIGINNYASSNTSANFTFEKLNDKKENITINQNTSSSTNPSKTVLTTKIITKKSSKITAKKATFKKSKKVKKYTITLKSGKNPIKKVKVTLKVKGKTYKATTNAKGKATFKITKLTKKGTFTAKISFKGNALYKAVSKSIKIKVK